MDDSTHRLAKIEHTLYGNGELGMDERLRKVEHDQEVNERARRTDREAGDEAMSAVYDRLGSMERKLNESAGGWRVAKIMAGFLVPVMLTFLTYIAVAVSGYAQ